MPTQKFASIQKQNHSANFHTSIHFMVNKKMLTICSASIWWQNGICEGTWSVRAARTQTFRLHIKLQSLKFSGHTSNKISDKAPNAQIARNEHDIIERQNDKRPTAFFLFSNKFQSNESMHNFKVLKLIESICFNFNTVQLRNNWFKLHYITLPIFRWLQCIIVIWYIFLFLDISQKSVIFLNIVQMCARNQMEVHQIHASCLVS